MELNGSNLSPPLRPLTAVAILPNRSLAQQFLRALPESRAFQIAAEWTGYPALAKLDSQLRQARPDVLLVDVTADLAQATAIIAAVTALAAPVPVIALHLANEGGALLECLRAGAVEFLYAPFTRELQIQAVARIAALLPGKEGAETRRGRLVVFASAKPGSMDCTLHPKPGRQSSSAREVSTCFRRPILYRSARRTLRSCAGS
jgi:CheY-like chemotaxis protein